ncbi:unnamed protein product [Didymodactylos carnosus]|uniref:Peptidase M14 domain-containing protein n=1 Tax=Didymodactylos carnosus TaxID=1234261 RepID=A0A813Z4E3_9BILA|nr:unnamed protein product [Didymodactylos carnosus]CAF3677227.1 unnamed protein product [Didymodactylos carnosus]
MCIEVNANRHYKKYIRQKQKRHLVFINNNTNSIYDGIPLPNKIRPSAPPLELPDINLPYFTARTTYYTHPSSSTFSKRSRLRRRNRTRTTSALQRIIWTTTPIFLDIDGFSNDTNEADTDKNDYQLTKSFVIINPQPQYPIINRGIETTSIMKTLSTITTNSWSLFHPPNVSSDFVHVNILPPTKDSTTSRGHYPKQIQTTATNRIWMYNTTTSYINRGYSFVQTQLPFYGYTRSSIYYNRYLSTIRSTRYRPPPPTVPRSFTRSFRPESSTRYTQSNLPPTLSSRPYVFSSSISNPTLRLTSTTIPTLLSPSSTESNYLIPSFNKHEWLFDVPSLSLIIDNYPRFSTITKWLHELSQHQNISKFFSYQEFGKTYENRSLLIAKIGILPFNSLRRSIWLDSGIHAREWLSTATVLYTIARLINGTLARDNHIRELIDNYDFYFMPVVNPDGYEFTHTGGNFGRMWRKNRRPPAITADRVNNECYGVDLNRNFPYAWDNRGSSKFSCEETYRGPYPESEPEVRCITSFIMKRKRYFQSFLTMHAFGNYWMLPWSFTTRIRSYDYYKIEKLIINANKQSGNTFKIGQSSILLYPATGTSEDWAKAVANIPHTFSIELPPSTDSFDTRQNEMNGFSYYHENDIAQVAENTFRMIRIYLKDVIKEYRTAHNNNNNKH